MTRHSGSAQRDADLVAYFDNGAKTLRETGEFFGITRERARQILKKYGVFQRRYSHELYVCEIEGCERTGRVPRGPLCAYHRRRRNRGLPDEPRRAEHGSIGMYTTHGCRCELCAERMRYFNLKRKLNRYAERDENGVHPRAPHGTRNGYGNYGCRCDLCRAFWSEWCKGDVQRGYAITYRARKRAQEAK